MTGKWQNFSKRLGVISLYWFYWNAYLCKFGLRNLHKHLFCDARDINGYGFNAIVEVHRPPSSPSSSASVEVYSVWFIIRHWKIFQRSRNERTLRRPKIQRTFKARYPNNFHACKQNISWPQITHAIRLAESKIGCRNAKKIIVFDQNSKYSKWRTSCVKMYARKRKEKLFNKAFTPKY